MSDYSVDDYFDPSSPYYNGGPTFGSLPPGAQNAFTDGIAPSAISSGEMQGNTTVTDGFLKSENYVAGVSGWYLSPTTGEINFSLSVQSLNIPDSTTANSFHVDSSGNVWWGANVATGYAGAPAYVLDTGAALFKSIQIGGSTLQYQTTDSGISSFGDGSDGDVVISVDTTLTRDMYYNNLTLNSGKVLSPAGYRIFVKNTFTWDGAVSRNGNDGSVGNTNINGSVAGGLGGLALADGYLKGTSAGGDGGSASLGASTSGVAPANTSNSLGSNAANSGKGGTGDAAAGSAATTGGTATASNVKLIANWHLATLLDVSSSGSTVKFTNCPSAPGGGGGGRGGANNSGTSGGGGGSAGGIIAIYAKTIIRSATGTCNANGGNGGKGGPFTGAGSIAGCGGGGAGANGGIIIIVYNVFTDAGSNSVVGGVGGTTGVGSPGGTYNGDTGASGVSGVVYTFNISL